MIKTITSLWLSLFVIVANSQQEADELNSAFGDLVTEYKNVGVGAAYSLEGETVWKSSMGFANKTTGTKFSNQTLTRIASISKLLTAISIMQLVEEGKINIDEPIRLYLQDYPQKGKTPITVRHLLTHTSGIAGYKNFKEATSTIEYGSLSEVVDVFSNRSLKFEPGTDFLYTSYGYVVLGLIIEKISGLSYGEYIAKNILEIASMQNTGIERLGNGYKNKSSLYHMQKGKIIEPQPNNLSNRIPAGGLYSTVEDMMKFGDAVSTNKLIGSATLSEMLKIGFPIEGNPYGLGWRLYGPKGKEHLIIGHEGGQYGANTQLILIPKIRSTIVVLSNTSETPDKNIGQFASKILNKILIENQEKMKN